jgi:hypothetical protein
MDEFSWKRKSVNVMETDLWAAASKVFIRGTVY